MIDTNNDILHCMCTAKLEGESKRWYENNMPLVQWEILKSALLQRFTTADSSSKLFDQLKERKQRSDETIRSYYDAIIKLCHEYDSCMSQKMMISWLENGIKDSLKIPIKRQMKSLSDAARTTQAFLKIAKDEQELQEENMPDPEHTSSYLPYFANTVSTALQQTGTAPTNTSNHPYAPRTITSHQSKNLYQQKNSNELQRPPPQNRYLPPQQRPFTPRPQSSTSLCNTYQPKLKSC